LYLEYAILPTVIIMKKRGWILYPYSIFHAKIVDGFAHDGFIHNPAAKYHHLIIWYCQSLIVKFWLFFRRDYG